MKIRISRYHLFKYLIYLVTFVIMTLSFLRFADDDLQEEKLKKAQRPHWVWKYILLYIDMGAIVSVYVFIYDGRLYKMGLFVALLTLGIIMRAIYGVQMDFLRVVFKVVAMALALLLILTVWRGLSENVVFNLRIPCYNFMQTKVDAKGNIISKRTSTTTSSQGSQTPPTTADEESSKRSNTTVKSKNKGSKKKSRSETDNPGEKMEEAIRDMFAKQKKNTPK